MTGAKDLATMPCLPLDLSLSDASELQFSGTTTTNSAYIMYRIMLQAQSFSNTNPIGSQIEFLLLSQRELLYPLR